MRTALLSAVKRTANGGLRAELMLSGRSVLAWQVELARELGCERIICLCETPGGEVLAMQREVETSGGEFHAIRGNIQLTSLMRADDELVMLLDGLLIERDAVPAFIAQDGRLLKGIATIPASHSLAEGHPEDFERIDRERHWAGFAVMRANLVQKLADLPLDGDAMSLLLRLGLQARLEGREVSDEALETGHWMLAAADNALAERERALIAASTRVPSWSGPGRALASTFVRQTAPRWLEAGAEVSAGMSIVAMSGGAVLAGLGWGAAGLGVASLGAFSGALSHAWSTARKALWGKERGAHFARVLSALGDVLAIAALVLALFANNRELAILALPIFAIGLANLASRNDEGAARAFFLDRSFQLALFAVTAGFGFLAEALALFGLGALAQLMLRKGAN